MPAAQGQGKIGALTAVRVEYFAVAVSTSRNKNTQKAKNPAFVGLPEKKLMKTVEAAVIE